MGPVDLGVIAKPNGSTEDPSAIRIPKFHRHLSTAESLRFGRHLKAFRSEASVFHREP